MLGDVDAVRGVGGAGAAGDEADPRPSREPPERARHHRRARLLPADRHLDIRVVERVERGEVGFARHAIDPLDPLRCKLIDQDLAAGAGVCGHVHLRRRGVWQVGAGNSIGRRLPSLL